MGVIKTAELTGAALDWAVGYIVANGVQISWSPLWKCWTVPCLHNAALRLEWHPSTDWAQGGPIIDREIMHPYPLRKNKQEFEWCCATTPWQQQFQMFGPTLLIAAMRCFVASKLGDKVDVPEELL